MSENYGGHLWGDSKFRCSFFQVALPGSNGEDGEVMIRVTPDGLVLGGIGTPTQDGDVATKKYVDDMCGDVETALSTINTALESE